MTMTNPFRRHHFQVISKTDGEYVEAMHTSSQVLQSSDFPARASSHLLSTENFSIQDICSTEPLAHVDFYPNGGLSQVLQTLEE